jgi:hypothetical protein
MVRGGFPSWVGTTVFALAIFASGGCGPDFVQEPAGENGDGLSSDQGDKGQVDAGRDGDLEDGGGAEGTCNPGEVQGLRTVNGGEGCEAGAREEALTCLGDGTGFDWVATTDFDGSDRQCEGGTVESRESGCWEEVRTCAPETCTWSAWEWAMDCLREQVVFVNFEGVTIDDCPGNCEDPRENKSLIVGAEYGGSASSWTFEPFTRGADAEDEILNKLSGYYARYLIRFVKVRPESGPYTMAVVTDTHMLPNHGVCPLDCDNTSEQICLINNITDNTNDTIARFVAHELGHSFGLHHVDNIAAIMNWDSSGSAFTASPLAEDQSCGLTLGQTQDAPSMLGNALGLRDEENVGASCHVAGVEGSCIDTDTTGCDGLVHVGACPGPAAIRCCTP